MIIIMFAGPNGSGKTTLVEQVLQKENAPDLYICPDELLKEFIEIENIKDRYIKAMELAEQLRIIAVENKKSFAFETVFSNKEKLDFLKFAKSKGYSIETIYITTNNPKINIERIQSRAAQGGHDVPIDKITSRYERSMKLIPDIIMASDIIRIYDNSGDSPKTVFIKTATGEMRLLNKETRHKWVEDYIVNPLFQLKYILEIPIDLNISETENYLKSLE